MSVICHELFTFPNRCTRIPQILPKFTRKKNNILKRMVIQSIVLVVNKCDCFGRRILKWLSNVKSQARSLIVPLSSNIAYLDDKYKWMSEQWTTGKRCNCKCTFLFLWRRSTGICLVTKKKRDYAVFFLHSLNFKDAKTNATTESYLGMFAVLCIPGIATYRRISEYVTHTDIFP